MPHNVIVKKNVGGKFVDKGKNRVEVNLPQLVRIVDLADASGYFRAIRSTLGDVIQLVGKEIPLRTSVAKELASPRFGNLPETGYPIVQSISSRF
jgi:hypothetical protein